MEGKRDKEGIKDREERPKKKPLKTMKKTKKKKTPHIGG
jgi:hypothetical protein